MNPPQRLITIVVACVLASQARAGAGEIVTVEGDARNLREAPVIAEYRGSIRPGTPVVLESRDAPDVLMAADVFQDGEKTYVGFVFQPPNSSGRWTYELRQGNPRPAGSGIVLSQQRQRVAVEIEGQPWTTYVPDDGPKPYFFPLLGPRGERMTRSFPMAKVEGEKTDHPHQRSLWFTHGSVNKVDFWSELPGHGSIRETSRPTLVGGLAVGVLRTTDDWHGPGGNKICEDERVVRFYYVKDARVLDYEVVLKASNGPVTFGDTKEGMFGLRVPTSMDVTSKAGGRIVNAAGLVDKAAWGQASPWVDYSGPVEGKTVGIAILNHPDSFRAPTTWHVRDYGLFAANPFGWKDFGRKESGEYVLPAGESIRFRYRVILHEGDAASANLPEAFRGYQTPPKVTFEAK